MFPEKYMLLLGEIELIAAYVVLAAILLSIALWNRVRWWIKAATIVVTFGFFFISFASVRQILGWPTSAEMPDRFELVWAFVQEPDEATQSSGAIYVWAMTLPGDGPVDQAELYMPGAIDTRVKADQRPRAYIAPYTRYLHQQVEAAKIRMVDGVRQIGVTDRKPKKPGEDAPQSQFSFYDRPDPILPPKSSGE